MNQSPDGEFLITILPSYVIDTSSEEEVRSVSVGSFIAQLPRVPRQLDTGIKQSLSVHGFMAQFHRQIATLNNAMVV